MSTSDSTSCTAQTPTDPSALGLRRFTIDVAPHPLLAPRVFVTTFPSTLGDRPSPEWLLSLLTAGAPAPVSGDDATRAAVRDLLRQGGFKPTGRSKPASEYLMRAASDGTLRSINAAVDVCNAVSLHSALPISVVDIGRLVLAAETADSPRLSLDLAPTTGSPGEFEANSAADCGAGASRAHPARSSTTAPKLLPKTRETTRNDLGGAKSRLGIGIASKPTSYVFNPSGQTIEVGGLVCLFDALGPCGSPVKDAQRTKTSVDTTHTLSIVWGSRTVEDLCERTTVWYRELLAALGAGTEAAT